MILVIFCHFGHFGPLRGPWRTLHGPSTWIYPWSIFNFWISFKQDQHQVFFSNPFRNKKENKVNNYFPISIIEKAVKISRLTKILQLKIFRDGFPAFSTQLWVGMTKNWTMVCLNMYFPLITNLVLTFLHRMFFFLSYFVVVLDVCLLCDLCLNI